MKLLIADDEAIIRKGLLKLDWTKAGITEVQSADNGLDALRQISTWNPDVVLTDIRMAGMNGLQIAKEVHESNERCKLIILSGYGTFEYAKEAFHNGVFDFLLKPSNPQEIFTTVKRAVEEIRRNTTQEIQDTIDQRFNQKNDDSNDSRKEQNTINRILQYIENNYMNDITLQSLSKEMHFSTTYLSKLIKKETSYNFTKIVCTVRMMKAAELLSTTNLKVYEICERIGMGDQRYFGQLFAKTFGQSPLEYRKSNKHSVEFKLLTHMKQIK